MSRRARLAPALLVSLRRAAACRRGSCCIQISSRCVQAHSHGCLPVIGQSSAHGSGSGRARACLLAREKRPARTCSPKGHRVSKRGTSEYTARRSRRDRAGEPPPSRAVILDLARLVPSTDARRGFCRRIGGCKAPPSESRSKTVLCLNRRRRTLTLPVTATSGPPRGCRLRRPKQLRAGICRRREADRTSRTRDGLVRASTGWAHTSLARGPPPNTAGHQRADELTDVGAAGASTPDTKDLRSSASLPSSSTGIQRGPGFAPAAGE